MGARMSCLDRHRLFVRDAERRDHRWDDPCHERDRKLNIWQLYDGWQHKRRMLRRLHAMHSPRWRRLVLLEDLRGPQHRSGKLRTLLHRLFAAPVPLGDVWQGDRRNHWGLGGAALSKGVPGLSRRDASRLKQGTLTRMEAERKTSACHVIVMKPDVIRGFDPVFAEAAEGRRYLMPVADAAVPKRTTVDVKERYAADAVYEVLKKDIEDHGAPLVYRMDRARQHDHPKVRALLDEHSVLVLHGPPHYPQYYGQLERQNREHRAVLDALGLVPTPIMLALSREKISAIDSRWPRRALGWRTAHEIWQTRTALQVDRKALRQDVQRMTAKIQSKQGCRGFPADMAERLAIEAALTKRGLLSRQGGRC